MNIEIKSDKNVACKKDSTQVDDSTKRTAEEKSIKQVMIVSWTLSTYIKKCKTFLEYINSFS